MTINKGLRIALIVTLIATLLSFGKFNHCRSAGWGSPDVYIHMCYSDISALYGAREINTDKWPYASQDNAVEYPVLTGIVMWATGLLIEDPNGYRPYFDLNILLIALLLFASVFILWRLKPEYVALFPIAPAVFGGFVAGSCIDLDFCIEGNCCIVVVPLVYSYCIVVGFEERVVAGSWYSYIRYVI